MTNQEKLAKLHKDVLANLDYHQISNVFFYVSGWMRDDPEFLNGVEAALSSNDYWPKQTA